MPDIKYVSIHPYNRTTFLHQSGLETLGDERISSELNANETGRAGRTAPGKVVYLFEFDDSEDALLKLKEKRGAQTPSQPGERVLPGFPHAPWRDLSTSKPSATPRVVLRAPPRAEATEEQHATLILGPPSRLPYIQGTMRQLQEKCFPNLFWLRLPDPLELDVLLDKTLAPKQRVMALWRTTVLPAVLQMCEKY